MKKRILKISLITLIFICAMLIFTNKANAYEYYNSEISYSDNYDGTVTVVAAGTSIESATIPSYINGKKVTEIDGFENYHFWVRSRRWRYCHRTGYGWCAAHNFVRLR